MASTKEYPDFVPEQLSELDGFSPSLKRKENSRYVWLKQEIYSLDFKWEPCSEKLYCRQLHNQRLFMRRRIIR